MAAYEYQNTSEKVIDQITDVNADKNASVGVNIAILNANAKVTKAIAYVKDANAKIADIIDANADPADAKVFGSDRNITNGQELIKFNFSKPIDDMLRWAGRASLVIMNQEQNKLGLNCAKLSKAWS